MTPDQANADAWTTTAIIPDLGDDDLCVFRVNLPVHEAYEQRCFEILSESERERVGRFKQELARKHALVGRGTLRSLLGRFLHIAPRDVILRLGSNGKPEVEGLAFNVAHSGNIILIAVTRTGHIGVDVERVNESTPVLDIADRYFAPTEIAQINAQETAEKQRGVFFSLWSRKEAIIKADGRGLSVELSSFATEDLTTLPDVTGTHNTFRVHALPVGREYAAALATNRLAAEPRLILYPAI